MSAIPETGDVLFCIDIWEITWKGSPGDSNQYADDAIRTEAKTTSEQGVEPDIAVSFGQALQACANTPALDARGEIVGQKRLVTSQEWNDAADGVVGDGGLTYPYGDTFDVDACACATEEGKWIYDGLQLTGSLPDCVSDFGVFDQSGNAWEWTDPEMYIDIEGFWAEAALLGVEISADEADYVMVSDAGITWFWIDVSGIGHTLAIDEGGYLIGQTESEWDGLGSLKPGYLAMTDKGGKQSRNAVYYLPVEPEATTDPPCDCEVRFRVMVERDSQPFADKRGGAYYTSATSCAVDEEGGYLGHHHDFDGTIGFRCALDAIPID
jgi:hypothetical protein